MKIDAKQIPPEGIALEEDISAQSLELENDKMTFISPIHARAEISRITNAISVKLELKAESKSVCSRCLKEFSADYAQRLNCNYQFDPGQPTLNLDTDIREEMLLGIPLKPLCSKDCKGLCPYCGKDRNLENCKCG